MKQTSEGQYFFRTAIIFNPKTYHRGASQRCAGAFAVSAWFYSSVRVGQQGMLSLQDGSHKDCLLLVVHISMQQSYDIFAKWQREWGNFLREVGKGNVKL